MSVLFRRSSFFIDFKTMLTYSDLYVGERLIEHIKESNLDKLLFTRLVNEFSELDEDTMRERLHAKKNVNFLLDYLNWSIVSNLEEADPVGFCNDLYDTLLYQEYDKEDKKSPTISFTNLANTLRALLKDSNAKEMYIFMEQPSSYLQLQTLEYFRSDKIKFVNHMDKKSFFETKLFDSYFFEDVDDVQYIQRKHLQRSEVIIPSFPFNVEGYDIDKTGEIVYSQDSFLKVPNLNEDPLSILQKYNLDLALVNIPL